jgi:agmatinase
MTLSLAKKNFLDIGNITLEKADVLIIPFGLEKSVTFGRGTAKGPQRIIEVSPNLETYDEELEKDIYKEVVIGTLKEPKVKEEHEEAIEQLRKITDDVYEQNKFPFVLGGEHSLTIGAVRSVMEKFSDISILQFDAHADLRDGYLGQKNSHASVMRRCLENQVTNLVQVGVRNISKENDELDFWKKNQNRIKTFWAKDMKSWKTKDICNALSKNVYLTFDVDAFDSSLMPSTGTPEPGGLYWYQVLEIIKTVAKEKNIIGADVVELAPISGFSAPDFLAAKLVYKIIGYKFFT